MSWSDLPIEDIPLTLVAGDGEMVNNRSKILYCYITHHEKYAYIVLTPLNPTLI